MLLYFTETLAATVVAELSYSAMLQTYCRAYRAYVPIEFSSLTDWVVGGT